jgi:large subunit ribosomal protein L22
MPGLKTNEVIGTRAVLRHYRMSAYKARQVLDLVRGMEVDRADELLRSTPREAARVVAKVLGSAVSNARNNEGMDPDELYVSACYADEGTTLKRWRPRARGRATRIRKRTCHITVIVSRLPDDRLERRRAREADRSAALRARRVAASKRAARETPPAKAAGRGAEEEVAEELSDLDEGVEAEGLVGEEGTEGAAEEGGTFSEDLEEPDEASGAEETGEGEPAEEDEEPGEPEGTLAEDEELDEEPAAADAEVEDEEAVSELEAEAPEEELGPEPEPETAKKPRRSRVPRVRKRGQEKD